MIDLTLVGIGTGNPQHLTLQAVEALNGLELILIPNKGAGKDDLAGLRRDICNRVIKSPGPEIVDFDLPQRDPATPSYRQRVDDWHDAIAEVWQKTIDQHLPRGGKVGFLVWGDPSLYDSTMRIAARLQVRTEVSLRVIPGITSIQALTASHAIPLNEIGDPVTITTGRQLREAGWPESADTLVIMLDGDCSFQSIDPEGVQIWWAAYAGMENEISLSGALREAADEIIKVRAKARAEHGWIMDIYILRRPARR
ncbi:MAG: precorrin-6A synthase (deacetylating) [Pseudophaeobacter sp. bin_em_oilr2.035]|uniref:Precorrin-6A synthase [deacetylating] n=1 Tax=Phaeobacter gallaeciensis TaxID=60890 RepID=A0ABD4XCP7_9RHOB|nr:precorrin-6A synthase (deacetylating) [Phaeobacter gallaeciensis]MDF1772084.1 precorrin-6A synthase (deacetylating) [Pseudophaeobacter sp. bin_em_oilr2.035]MDE4146135.1 precorrin-6A synthase (deacetylating) [Phaeobacter gallaeciensis]MDE4158808.1 precorrin-6A synthase (deacetylating) [Phaeobacter gallaeciensis]MDE4162985.1 precorrin-6A synthase (deacetylating) [Phaeobacter gallaeciensis]MDE4167215.1 precorrin-6A synthase (deacetylating) [Phaeobacter gallaeciensis]